MSSLRIALLALVVIALAGSTQGQVQVKSKSKPEKPWTEYATRTIDQLSGFNPAAVKLSQFGGVITTDKRKATGFFRIEKIDRRWWFIDPEGNRFVHVGVASVTPLKSPGALPAFNGKFGSQAAWAAATAKFLHDNGFNGTGAWSESAELTKPANRLAHTPILNLMSSFGKSKGITYQKPGHAGYPGDCFPVFHPEFEKFCDETAAKLAAPRKDDPWLLGYYSDNELPSPILDKYLALDPNDVHMASSRKAAEAWLAARQAGRADPITDADRAEFVAFVYDRYFEITTRAIRKHDPNHLCLGSRLHGADKDKPGAWRAAGKHLDAVAVNYYGVWTPKPQHLQNWTQWSGKPFMITEWYTKAEDSGMANTTGAGWIVPTQKDRGLFYQNFTLALLESRNCVGWHWFKYQDNDPADTRTDPSNRDSNKGIVNVKFEPYAPLLDEMRKINAQLYPLIQYFDRQ